MLTFWLAYHAGSPGFLGAIYVISGVTTTQPAATVTPSSSTGGANPSITIAGLSAGDLILEGIGGNNTLTAASSQTTDYTGTGNASNFAISEKTASAGSNVESWTMASAAYAFNAIAIKASSGTPVVVHSLGLLGVGS